MKKHRIDKIREVSGASASGITPEHHKKNVERIVDMLMPIVEKMQKLPQIPVKESFAELLAQMRSGARIPVSSTQIISGESEKKDADLSTFIKTGDDIGNDSGESEKKRSDLSTFTDEQIKLLEDFEKRFKR